MSRTTFTASACIAAMILAIAPAKAAYPDSGYAAHSKTATLSGTVQRIISPNEFMLRDDYQVVKVDIASDTPPVLNEGDNITVTGIRADGNRSLHVYSVFMNQRDNT